MNLPIKGKAYVLQKEIMDMNLPIKGKAYVLQKEIMDYIILGSAKNNFSIFTIYMWKPVCLLFSTFVRYLFCIHFYKKKSFLF